MLKSCDEVCGYKKTGNVNTWWWNSVAKDEIQKKKMHIEDLTNPTEETLHEYRRLKKAAKKAVARATKEEAARKMNELGRNPNNVLRLVRK